MTDDDIELVATPDAVAGLLRALPELGRLPLGAVSTAHRLIDLHTQAPETLRTLYNQGTPTIAPAGLVGAVLSFLAPEFPDATYRRAARRQRQRILSGQTNWPDFGAAHGSTFLICDDSTADLGLPRQLYHDSSSRELVPWSAFATLFGQIVGLTTGGKLRTGSDASVARIAALTTVIYELFKNTEDHATHDVSGADLLNSVRGIYAQYHTRDSIGSRIDSKSVAHPSPSLAFVESTLSDKRRPAKAVSGVLEISVFDSGPGMAARWSARDVSADSADEQMSYVLACFKKGQTSTASASRGFGLWKVLRSLEEVSGFIAVRTNGVRAYRRFDSAIYRKSRQVPLQKGGSLPEEALLDWRLGFAPHASLRPHTKGTSVSVLLPIDS